MTELPKYVVELLEAYRRNKAVLRLADLDEIVEPTSRLSQVPPSVTNKFNSNTENQAFNCKNRQILEREIKKVEDWLSFLNDLELYVVEQIHIYKRSYNQTSAGWYKQTGIIYHKNSLCRVRRNTISKICNIIADAVKMKNPG